MKLKHLLPLCALALPLCASAVPARPGYTPYTLADGSTVMVQLNGDEFFHFITDEQGFLMETTGNKLAYKLDPNGARMKATPVVLESMAQEAYKQLPAEMQRAAENGGVARIAPHDNKGRTTFPTTGEGHYAVILVNFLDIQWSMDDPIAAMNEKLNGENFNYKGAPGSMRQYYIDNSNGLFKPTFDILGIVDLPKTAGYYAGKSGSANVREMIAYAVQELDPEVDYSQYDLDDDGYIDNIIFFYAGYGDADTGKKADNEPHFIWPHNSRYPLSLIVDGKQFGNYCCFNELNGGSHYYTKDMELDGIGTPVHEFGHVMGLPDLYDPKYQVNTTPGLWSVMDSGAYNGDGHVPPLHSLYERWHLKWAEYTELPKTAAHYEIDALGNGGTGLRQNVYSNKNGDNVVNEYFLFESRQPSGWDSYLTYGGMLIWHIDYNKSVFLSNQVNSTASRNRCHLITADGSANYLLGNTSSTAQMAAWPRDINYITPDTEITLSANYIYSKGPLKDVYITNIAYDPETGKSSFDYNMVTSTPDVTTVLHTPELRGTGTIDHRTVCFKWDPVEGATSYQFTLYRINSQGNIAYENFFNDKDLGNVTEFEYTFASNKLNTEWTAWIRPVIGLPSKQTSNLQVFKPSELAVSGVEEIESAAQPVVKGLKGAIDAPASARVFTLTGAPAGRTDLPAGIYLVQVDGKTFKVLVK